MTVQIDVWSDFVCPFCYAAVCGLDQLKPAYDFEIRWRAYELRPAGSPPMPEAYRQRIIAGRPQLAQMMKERYGVDVVFGPADTNSRPALVGDKYAAAQGDAVGQAYHRAVLKAYWEQGRDIAQPDVLQDIAESVGLDGRAFLAALVDPVYEAEVDSDVEQAYRYNMSGVPALVFGGRYLVMGAQPNEVFAQVIERVEAEAANAG